MRVVYLIGILPFIFSCSYNVITPNKKVNERQDTYIDYSTFKGSSYDLNKVKKIDLLSEGGVAYYANKFNVPKEIIDVHKYWYLVTGVTQPNGGWYYQASIKSRNILLCLTSPDPFSPQFAALQAPLLLVGVDDSGVRPIFDETCAGKMLKGVINKNR